MRGALILLLLIATITGCASEPSPAERKAEAERDIAMVHEANDAAPPRREVIPDAIRYDDIEEHAMFGQACNYAPGTSLGTRVIARQEDAFIKVNGEVQRLAADSGSEELPALSRSIYTGRQYSLRLALAGEGAASGPDGAKRDFEGTISLRDQWGREVYRGSGLAQCGV